MKLCFQQVGFWRADEGIKVETESSQNLVYAEVRSVNVFPACICHMNCACVYAIV